MDGVHDIGGMHGFGPIEREDDEPVFHEAWEGRVLAISLALPMVLPLHDGNFRRAIEEIDPPAYLSTSYYERWLRGTCALLLETGAVSPEELDGAAAAALPDGLRIGPTPGADEIPPAIQAGAPGAMPDASDAPHRFRVGERVRSKAFMGEGHTRLPRFARDKIGVIESEHGPFRFADSSAANQGPQPQQLYTVVFAARDLWGEEAAEGDSLALDLWDSYLDPISD